MNKFAFDQTFKSRHINSLLTTNFYYDLYLYFRSLQEIDMETKQAIIDLLNKKRLPGLASWKQVARRYGMREKEISFLESGKTQQELCWRVWPPFRLISLFILSVRPLRSLDTVLLTSCRGVL